MKLIRRRSRDKQIEQSLTQLTEWLDVMCRLYAYGSVQLKHQYVETSSCSLEPYHAKKAITAIDDVIAGLSEFPLYSNQETENQIYNLVDLCLPLATHNQRVKLESLRHLNFSNLYSAIQINNLAYLLTSDYHLWTPTMVERLTLPLEDLEKLAIVWAKQQTFDNCLRENDPLIWLIKKLIAQLPPIPPELELRPSLLCRMCWNTWKNIPDAKFYILMSIQSNLPCQFVEQVPIIFYTLIFRHWCAAYPYMVRQVLDKFKRSTAIVTELKSQLNY